MNNDKAKPGFFAAPLSGWPRAGRLAFTALAALALGAGAIALTGAGTGGAENAASEKAAILTGVNGEMVKAPAAKRGGGQFRGSPASGAASQHGAQLHLAAWGHLSVGDQLTLTAKDGKTLTYQIIGLRAANDGASGLNPNLPAPEFALVTCVPYAAAAGPGPWCYVLEAVSLPAKPEPAVQHKL